MQIIAPLNKTPILKHKNKMNDLVNSDDHTNIWHWSPIDYIENQYLAWELDYKDNFTMLDDEKPQVTF